MKRPLFLLAALFPALLLQAQEAKQYSFTHYSVNNGLAAYNTINTVQDDDGYIWISTLNGLQRFDGSRFLTFKHNPSERNSLPSNQVYQLLYDSRKNLWVLMGDGSIGTFDTRRFTFRKADIITEVQKNLGGARILIEDAEGNLVLTYSFKEFVTYNKEKNEFSPAYNSFKLPASRRPTDIVDDPKGKRYIIASDSGLLVYNKVTQKLSYRDHNTEKEPLIERFGNLLYTGVYKVDSRRRLWFKNWPPNGGCSIYCYDMANNSAVLDMGNITPGIAKYNEPAGIVEQKDGSIWIIGLQVFAKYNEREKYFIPVYNGYLNDRSISYDAVHLFEDREQNLWVNTSNNGLYVFNPSKELFNSIGHLNYRNMEKGAGGAISYAKLKNGDLLVGYWDDGLFRYDSSFRSIKLNIKGVPEHNYWSPWSMFPLKDGNRICIAGQPAFIAFYDQQKETLKRYEPAIFETRTIRQVVEDRFGNLWFGSHSRGLYKWAAAKGVKNFEDGLYKINSIPNVKVLKLYTDSRGYLWVGTESAGVYKIDPSTDNIIEHLTSDGPEMKRLIVNGAAFIEYGDSLMIIGGGGLNFYNTKTNTIRHITSADGLPSDAIMSFERDKAGYLWIGMATGLCRMNVEKGTFTQYNRNDGMANDNFEISTSYQLPDGRMIFGSTSDFVLFNPLDVRTTAAPPDVRITEFRLLNNSLSVDSLLKLDAIELQSSESSITISYSILSYFNENKPVYYYMLEGIDKGWKKGNEVNQAIYNYLPAGTYTFRIRAENADAVTSKITTLVIKVSPPFWRSWWFYSLLVLIGILIFYLADRERLLRIKATQKLRNDIALSLHEEVNTSLNNINLLSEMARMKADKDISKSKELIGQISYRSNDMMIAMDDMLWVIDPANDSMEKTILRMSEFIDALRNRHEAEIEMHVDEKVRGLKLDMKLRHGFFFIFKTALRCMVQYSGAKQTLINIDLQQNGLCLKMHTPTFVNSADSNTMMCSTEMRTHAVNIKAELDMLSDKNGSSIVLIMPVR